MTAVQMGLSPVARAMIAGAVTAITPPASRGRGKRFWTVTLDTHEGALAVLVPTDHKIYARVASRARTGHFWVVEADLSVFHGRVEIHARHVHSDKDTYLPQSGARPEGAESPAREEPPAAGHIQAPRRHKAAVAAGQFPLAL